MKETIITSKRKRTEIITILVCFLIANILNLYSIIKFNTAFSELFTSLGYVAVATVVIYVAWTAIRLIIAGICKLLRKKS